MGSNEIRPSGQNEQVISKETLTVINQYLKDIRYGTITLVIQDGRIVQIEKSEKIKLK